MHYIYGMIHFPKKLQVKIDERAQNNALRVLKNGHALIDFSSNDYLGLASNEDLFAKTFQFLLAHDVAANGSSGSRLISGNHAFYGDLEVWLANFYEVESALVFNSGYDANVGFFSAVPQRGDVVFYDAHIHASIRDGIKMGHAKGYKFKHNDLDDLMAKCDPKNKLIPAGADVYVVTESVFSMDGDTPDLEALAAICSQNGFYLVIDEAHAIGVFGKNGSGLIQGSKLENSVFARIITFGKALGCHGAAILGPAQLKPYLINFARSLIYTTALPPHTLATIISSFSYLESIEGQDLRKRVQGNIAFFREKLVELKLNKHFLPSNSAIQCCKIMGNSKVKKVSKALADDGFDVKAILAPTVPEGQERLRFCIHATNSKAEIGMLLAHLQNHLK